MLRIKYNITDDETPNANESELIFVCVYLLAPILLTIHIDTLVNWTPKDSTKKANPFSTFQLQKTPLATLFFCNLFLHLSSAMFAAVNPRSLPYKLIISLSLLLLLIPTPVSADCTTQDDQARRTNKTEALKYKLAAIASVLVAGGIGVSLPILGRRLHILNPENDVFFMIKAFAAGVILATGFVHILPDAFRTLTSPCLSENPWHKFPFVGFVAMVAAIGTLTVDTVATSFYKNMHFNKSKLADLDEEAGDEAHDGHVHVHTHATHGHAHGGAAVASNDMSLSDLVRQRIISQVLELGIVVHSVIIGVSLGASESVDTIKPLLAALSFHQFFEGMGLGGCISQAKFKSVTTTIMMLFFSLTTPIGIGVGIGISSVYKDDSPKGLIVEGIFNSASGGILVYMALVDLLAADFMNPRMQSNIRLMLGAHISLLLGAACMSFLAKWA